MSHRICSIEDCDKLHLSRGYCGMHYRRFRLHGDPLGGNPFMKSSPSRLCSVDGCERVHAKHGLCSAHEARRRKHGSPTGGRGSASLGIAPRVTPCATDGCAQDAKANGLCWAHHKKAHYLANPETYARYAANYRARRRGAFVESFAPRDIFERDDWRCGLCGKKVRQTLRHPHPQSASLDHIVPLSEGGEHSRRNTQTAHLLCNLRKGKRGSQQLALIG